MEFSFEPAVDSLPAFCCCSPRSACSRSSRPRSTASGMRSRRINEAPGRPFATRLWNRLKAFLTLIGLGVVVLIAFVAQVLLSAMESWAAEEHLVWASFVWPRLQITLSLAAEYAGPGNGLQDGAARVRARGARQLVGASSWPRPGRSGRRSFSRYIVGGHYTAYGVVGSFIAMMLWVYCASIILFLGAQLVQVLGHPEESTGGAAGSPSRCGRRRGAARGHQDREKRQSTFDRGDSPRRAIH